MISLEGYFFFVTSLVFVYIVLGNYLYLAKVIPQLEKVDPSENWEFTPSKQYDQVRRYVKSLAGDSVKPWYFFYLKHIGVVSIILGLLFFPLIVSFFI